jgi:hypothetical protein
MIDVQLIVAIVAEFGNIEIGSDAARAMASDMEGLNALMRLARPRLQFQDSPYDEFRRLSALE